MLAKLQAAFGACLVVVALGAALPAAAQVLRGDAVAGQNLAQVWCSACHAVGANEMQVKDDVPSFLAISEMPSTTALSLNAWLQTPHPNMPNLQLTKTQIEDVNAYILSLKGQAVR